MCKKKFSWETEEEPIKVGKAVYDILKQKPEHVEVGEILEEYKHKYLEEILDCIQKNKHKYESPFYIVVLTKKEPWALNVMRNWFIARQTKPAASVLSLDYPNHMNTVYEIKNGSDLKIMWSLPIAQDANVVVRNKDLYDPQLVKWIMDFREGKLG